MDEPLAIPREAKRSSPDDDRRVYRKGPVAMDPRPHNGVAYSAGRDLSKLLLKRCATNNERITTELATPISVIVGNPPFRKMSVCCGRFCCCGTTRRRLPLEVVLGAAA